MFWSLGIGIYLVIGALFSLWMYSFINKKVEDYEDGKELDKEDIDRLEETREHVQWMGGKGYVIFLFITCTLFWLPMLIFNPPGKG